jgi:hypothetical protein
MVGAGSRIAVEARSGRGDSGFLAIAAKSGHSSPTRHGSWISSDRTPRFPFASMFPRSAAFMGLAAVVASAPALAVALVFAGCGSGANPPSPSGATPTTIHAFVADASDAGASDEVPQGTARAQSLQGSPLCHASYSSCFPDDVLNACDLPVDGGSSDAGFDLDVSAAPACHVIMSGSNPGCLPAGLGMTNATCSQSDQCAAGHECIGAGSCRHYCCAGTSACQINEFCDVQPTAQDPTIVVPVCMPQLPCLLLEDAFCPATQQCSVVREDGTTSCVNVGTAQDGDRCDAEHCARGLVCIGAQDAATCAPLCYTADPHACANTAKPGRACVAMLPLFRSKAVGVCQ